MSRLFEILDGIGIKAKVVINSPCPLHPEHGYAPAKTKKKKKKNDVTRTCHHFPFTCFGNKRTGLNSPNNVIHTCNDILSMLRKPQIIIYLRG